MDPEEYALNAYAQCGWIAGATFCEGLRRLEDSGEEVTWTNYIAAMEEAPVAIPFGAVIDYAGGMRTGTQSMNLFRATRTIPPVSAGLRCILWRALTRSSPV